MNYPKREKGCDCRHTLGRDPRCEVHGNKDRVKQHDAHVGFHNSYYCDVCMGGQDQVGFNSSLD